MRFALPCHLLLFFFASLIRRKMSCGRDSAGSCILEKRERKRERDDSPYQSSDRSNKSQPPQETKQILISCFNFELLLFSTFFESTINPFKINFLTEREM